VVRTVPAVRPMRIFAKKQSGGFGGAGFGAIVFRESSPARLSPLRIASLLPRKPFSLPPPPTSVGGLSFSSGFPRGIFARGSFFSGRQAFVWVSTPSALTVPRAAGGLAVSHGGTEARRHGEQRTGLGETQRCSETETAETVPGTCLTHAGQCLAPAGTCQAPCFLELPMLPLRLSGALANLSGWSAIHPLNQTFARDRCGKGVHRRTLAVKRRRAPIGGVELLGWPPRRKPGFGLTRAA
jgi:hypothetical protein